MKEKLYMNIKTGQVANYEGWFYTDEDRRERNAVDRKEVVEVYYDTLTNEYKEVN